MGALETPGAVRRNGITNDLHRFQAAEGITTVGYAGLTGHLSTVADRPILSFGWY